MGVKQRTKSLKKSNNALDDTFMQLPNDKNNK